MRRALHGIEGDTRAGGEPDGIREGVERRRDVELSERGGHAEGDAREGLVRLCLGDHLPRLKEPLARTHQLLQLGRPLREDDEEGGVLRRVRAATAQLVRAREVALVGEAQRGAVEQPVRDAFVQLLVLYLPGEVESALEVFDAGRQRRLGVGDVAAKRGRLLLRRLFQPINAPPGV